MNEDSDNCYEYGDCPKDVRETCEAYKNNMGNECWFIMNIKRGCTASRKYGSCINCPFYKKFNP